MLRRGYILPGDGPTAGRYAVVLKVPVQMICFMPFASLRSSCKALRRELFASPIDPDAGALDSRQCRQVLVASSHGGGFVEG